MNTVETSIARRASRALLAAGYHLGVHDGEERTVESTDRLEIVMGALGTTELDNLIVLTPGGERVASVALIWGNDEDLISDIAAPTPEQMDRVDAILSGAVH